MKPLNTQDRMKQFLIFLAFFLVTVALVVAVTYYDFANPKEHNRLLIEENANLKRQLEVNDKYLSQADSVLSKITKLSINDPSAMETKYGFANTQNSNFASVVESDSLLKNGIYSRFSMMTTTFLELYAQYKVVKPKANDFETTKLENDKLDRENKELQKDLIECQKKKPAAME
ncbi:MAG TPA: hypothetical protein PLU53_01625 [Bacteroidia bacterium]|nr:hypothetical protein [Bacteroidia bacterium]